MEDQLVSFHKLSIKLTKSNIELFAVGYLSTQASNYPLRGQKGSGWEGSVRTVGMIYSPLISKKNRVTNEMFHITDILPTLARRVGFKIDQPIDGVDQWDMINSGLPSRRKEILHIADTTTGYSAYTKGCYKIVNGTVNNGIYDGWLGDTNNTNYGISNYFDLLTSSDTYKAIERIEGKPFKLYDVAIKRKLLSIQCRPKWKKNNVCNPLKKPCLFNIKADPCEQNNLADVEFEKFREMQFELEKKVAESIPPRFMAPDPKCDPVNFNFTWNWWQPDT
jgi:arylsulfatase B